jgi:medium-chain acyl-[acyl-carrier-protein] hydrolase
MTGNRRVTSDGWVVTLDVRPAARLRLLCFPYAGAGPGVFREWPPGLPPDIEPAAVRLPGRESRLHEPPFWRLGHLLPHLDRGLGDYLAGTDGRRLAFFGHSMGALLAFESARLLRRRGRDVPDTLVVSGIRAPQLAAPEGTPVHQLSDDHLLAGLGRYSGVPEPLLTSEAMRRTFLPTLRADFAMVETHPFVAEPPLPCHLVAYSGDHDPDITAAHMHAWSDHAGRSFRRRSFSGGHFYLNRRRQEVLAALAGDLAGS